MPVNIDLPIKWSFIIKLLTDWIFSLFKRLLLIVLNMFLSLYLRFIQFDTSLQFTSLPYQIENSDKTLYNSTCSTCSIIMCLIGDRVSNQTFLNEDFTKFQTKIYFQKKILVFAYFFTHYFIISLFPQILGNEIIWD